MFKALHNLIPLSHFQSSYTWHPTIIFFSPGTLTFLLFLKQDTSSSNSGNFHWLSFCLNALPTSSPSLGFPGFHQVPVKIPPPRGNFYQFLLILVLSLHSSLFVLYIAYLYIFIHCLSPRLWVLWVQGLFFTFFFFFGIPSTYPSAWHMVGHWLTMFLKSISSSPFPLLAPLISLSPLLSWKKTLNCSSCLLSLPNPSLTYYEINLANVKVW